MIHGLLVVSSLYASIAMHIVLAIAEALNIILMNEPALYHNNGWQVTEISKTVVLFY